MKKRYLAIVAVFLMVYPMAFMELVTDYIISSHGRVKAVNCDVYWDAELINLVTELDWGDIQYTVITQRIVYVHNSGNRDINLTGKSDMF